MGRERRGKEGLGEDEGRGEVNPSTSNAGLQ
jgi:hypothetical protein